MADQADDRIEIAEEDRRRAEFYVLLARLMYDPPDADLLAGLRGLEGDDSDLGAAVAGLAEAARDQDPDAINDEYQSLFVRIDEADLKPYASYALTGSYYSRPLIALREDMDRLGITRLDGVREPEDHITPVCEMMAGLILGRFGGQAASLDEQQRFFERHLQPWAPDFFKTLAATESTPFYARVGRLGDCFLAIERRSFEMAH